MSDTKLLTIGQVAAFLGTSPSTVYRKVASGNLRTVNTAGGLRVRADDLVAYINQQLVAVDRGVQRNPLETAESGDQNESTDAGSDDSERKGQLKRRKFLKGSLALATTTVVTAIGGALGMLAYDEFAKMIANSGGQRADTRLRLKVIDQLFGGLPDFSWSAGISHLIDDYHINWAPQSSNAIASNFLASALKLHTNDWPKEVIPTSTSPGPVRIDTNLIAVGSPISDPIAQLGFQYYGSHYDLGLVPNRVIDLPFDYVLDRNYIGYTTTLAKRYVAGEIREMPNWALRKGSELIPPPILGKGGWIESDYLLITRIPNILSQQAFVSGGELLIIGGTHGIGTEAIGLLLKDTARLTRIQNDRGSSTYYQILVPVTQVNNVFDGVRMHSLPVELGDPMTEPVVVDLEKVLEQWTKRK